VIFVHQNLISNRLTYIVHAKSSGELALDLAIAQSEVWSQRIALCPNEKRLYFCLIIGLSPNLGLSKSLSLN